MKLSNNVNVAETQADALFTKFQKMKGELEDLHEVDFRKPDRKRQNGWKKNRRLARKFRHDFAFEI